MKFINSKVFILMVFFSSTIMAQVPGKHHGHESWSGEVIDMSCYVANGAKGQDHSGCAKACIKAGQPMGLLTDDGALVLLAADHKDGEPYERLKDLAGEKATVYGKLAERDGQKLVTVTGSSAQ